MLGIDDGSSSLKRMMQCDIHDGTAAKVIIAIASMMMRSD